jgi:ketosteroid isomerase-like protein
MTTVISPNIETIQKMYDAFNVGDLETLRRDLFATDIRWTMAGNHPLSGLHEGIDAVMAFLSALSKAGIVVDNVHVGELDNGIVVEKHIGHGSVNGKDYLFPTCTSYELRDGRVAEVNVHANQPGAVNEYMWAKFTLKPLPDRLVDGQA